MKMLIENKRLFSELETIKSIFKLIWEELFEVLVLFSFLHKSIENFCI